MTLTADQIARYRTVGHLTVPAVFTAAQMDEVTADATAWGDEVLGRLTDDERAWYVERNAPVGQVLRKLDDPVHNRPLFRRLAADADLVKMVEALIGPGVTVCFSQIFMKPPGGGPKPVHQDNFYFGPSDPQGLVTAWIALDDATIANGCLSFAEGTHLGPVYEHAAPPNEPFNLQLPPGMLVGRPLTPAPVPRGGVSFHHGCILHRSSANTSDQWRRAVAIHYVNNQTHLTQPALPYDEAKMLRVT